MSQRIDSEKYSRLPRRLFMSAGAALLTSTLLVGPSHAKSAPKRRNRLVIQVSDNDPGKWGLALNNANNVLNDLGAATVDLEIVVYGPGIGMLKSDSPLASRIAQALQQGVQIVACENTLKAQQLSHAEMLPDIGYVPAGVVELMKKQQQGFAYIRP